MTHEFSQVSDALADSGEAGGHTITYGKNSHCLLPGCGRTVTFLILVTKYVTGSGTMEERLIAHSWRVPAILARKAQKSHLLMSKWPGKQREMNAGANQGFSLAVNGNSSPYKVSSLRYFVIVIENKLTLPYPSLLTRALGAGGQINKQVLVWGQF